MKNKGIVILIAFLFFIFSSTVLAKEGSQKIRPAATKDEKKKEKKGVKPVGFKIENIKYEDISRILTEEMNKWINEYKDILKEEIKPKGEFETEEEYKKRIEGASKQLNIKKIQLIEKIYKSKKYYQIKELPVSLPQYNVEEQFFDIKLITLPILENVIYQPPEEETGLRFVPSENGVELYLKLKISPEKGKNLRENDKFIMVDFVFTTYLSLKSNEDINAYGVVALSDIDLYIKQKDSVSNVYKKSLRINTPTFPKKE